MLVRAVLLQGIVYQRVNESFGQLPHVVVIRVGKPIYVTAQEGFHVFTHLGVLFNLLVNQLRDRNVEHVVFDRQVCSHRVHIA